MVLYLLNALVVPFKGEEAEFRIRRISVEEARNIVNKTKQIVSAVGHESTAKALSILLGIPVEVNRVSIFFDVNDEAIVFTLKTRLPEGKVIQDVAELEKIGYELFHVVRVS